MTGYTSKRKVALDKLDDDDIQTYQRPWVGLTDVERSQLVTLHHGWNEYGQAIEAELRSKNT